ncbi:MAG: hypothetical protein P8Y76_02515 [bacterium]
MFSCSRATNFRSRRSRLIAERAPGRAQRGDQRVFARAEPAYDECALNALHAARIGEQLPRRREIVQFAEQILQCFEVFEIAAHPLALEAVCKELAGIAQALQANTHLMARAAVRPVAAIATFLDLARQALGRAPGEGRQRRLRLRFRFRCSRDCRSVRPFGPDHRIDQKLLKLARGGDGARVAPRTHAPAPRPAQRRREIECVGRARRDALLEELGHDIPVARHAKWRQYATQTFDEPLRGLGRCETAEYAQRRAQASQANAELMQILRIPRDRRATRICSDLGDAIADDGCDGIASIAFGIERGSPRLDRSRRLAGRKLIAALGLAADFQLEGQCGNEATHPFQQRKKITFEQLELKLAQRLATPTGADRAAVTCNLDASRGDAELDRGTVEFGREQGLQSVFKSGQIDPAARADLLQRKRADPQAPAARREFPFVAPEQHGTARRLRLEALYPASAAASQSQRRMGAPQAAVGGVEVGRQQTLPTRLGFEQTPEFRCGMRLRKPEFKLALDRH